MGSFCYFCGKRGLPGATCSTCGIAIPDPNLPDAIATALMCPRCVTVALAPIVLEPGLVCHACARCHGVLLTARSWCALVARPALATAFEANVPARAAPATELLALLSCPACKREMERGRFAASSNVVVDVCVLHGMWLDRGELTDVVKHAAVRGAQGGGDLAAEVQRALPAVIAANNAANSAADDGATPTKRGGLITILLVGGLLLALGGGLATLRAFVVVKDHVKDVTNSAASASGNLE